MALPTVPSNGGSCLIEVRKLFGEISVPDDVAFQCKRSEVCIFRVPKFLKDLNEKAYVPQLLSLGPLREVNRQPSVTDDRLSITKADKMRAVVRMLRRCHPPKEIEDVIREIRDLEMKIKDCYEVAIPYERDALASMLTLDGCFILEILRAATFEFSDCPSSESFEPIFDGERLGSLQGFLLLRDVMLLENQIPLVVLIRLLELELGSTEKAQEKLRKVLNDHTLKNLIPFRYNPGEGESIKCQLDDIRNSKHLLDLLRTKIISSFLQCEKRPNNNGNCTEHNGYSRLPEPADEYSPNNHGNGIEHNGYSRFPESADEYISMPSAEILQNVGIEFQRCGGEDRTRIRFESKTWRSATATLFLPTIRIAYHTETILRSLIAYEECRAERDNRISLYAMLMDAFIESKEDVGVLKKAGIICPDIGSDKEVADLFNNLCKGITQRQIADFDNIISDVKKHYKSKFKVLVAEFVGKHCSKPWLLISLVAGVMLLGMNLLRTVFSIVDRF